jgi:hypothetical protein
MSRVVENFLFKFKEARNIKESFSVIDEMKRFLKKKKESLDVLLTELSSSKLQIRFSTKAASTRMTTAPTGSTGKGKTVVNIDLKPADVKKIQQSWDVLVDYNDTITMLEESLLKQTVQMYKNVPGLKEQVASTKKFLDDCKKSRDEVLKKLDATSSALVPDCLEPIIKDVKEKLETSLKGRFESCSFMIYPNVIELKGKHPLAFFCYIQFKGLTDDDRYRKDSFSVIIIAVKDEKTQDFQYQVQTDEQGRLLPNEIDVDSGDWIGKVQGVENRILSQLTDQHALNVLVPKPLNKTQLDVKKNRSIKNAHKAVLDMFIEENYLKVITDPALVITEADARAVTIAVHSAVKAFFDLGSSANMSAKPITDGKVWCIYFKLDADMDKQSISMRAKYGMDRSELLAFATKLGLDKHTTQMLEDSYKHYLFTQYRKIKSQQFPNTPEDAPGYVVNPAFQEDARKEAFKKQSLELAPLIPEKPKSIKMQNAELKIEDEDINELRQYNKQLKEQKELDAKNAKLRSAMDLKNQRAREARQKTNPVQLKSVKVSTPSGLKDLILNKELEDEVEGLDL